MGIDEELLRVRREARIGELELWLALMVLRHGERNGSGYRLTIDAEDVDEIRSRIFHSRPTVAIDLDLSASRYVLDVL